MNSPLKQIPVLIPLILAVNSVFSFLPAALAQCYTVIDLGTPLLAGSYSDPHGLGQSGAVVGEWESLGSGFQRGFIFSDGTNVDLGALGGVYTIAWAVNGAKQAVGESAMAGVGDIHAFLWANGSMSDLGTIAGTYSSAFGVNSAGDVVGESSVSISPTGPVDAFWRHGGVNQDLGLLPNGDYSSANAINDSEVIVGQASVVEAGLTNIYAFVYSNAVMNPLGTLGGKYGDARGINNLGQIAGESSLANGDVHAFLYNQGSLSDLGGFGGNYSTAAGINRFGAVAGYALDASSNAFAFVCNGGPLLKLDEQIGPSTVCTNLITADGINDAGQIAGSGFTALGEYHAFLLTPIRGFTAPALSANGQFSATLRGVPGERFDFQCSSNLFDWSTLATYTLVTNTINCVDSTASGEGQRFYRALQQPVIP